MMITPPEIRPIDATPITLPGAARTATPEGGLGQTGGQSAPGGTPQAGPTGTVTVVPTAQAPTGPGAGAEPTGAAPPATPRGEITAQPTIRP